MCECVSVCECACVKCATECQCVSEYGCVCESTPHGWRLGFMLTGVGVGLYGPAKHTPGPVDLTIILRVLKDVRAE